MNVGSYQTTGPVSTARSPAALGRLACAIVLAFPMIKTWLFHGSLGAGKTTAIRGLLRYLGVKKRVVSPTYTLMQSYRLPGGQTAVHLDAYRVKHQREWAALGIDEFLHPRQTYLFVEWPERLRGFSWGPRGIIKIAIVPTGRSIRWRVIFKPPAGGRSRGRQRPVPRHRRSSPRYRSR